jgi:hypothetical protein
MYICIYSRVSGEHAQTSDDVARVVVNIAIMGADDKKRSFTGKKGGEQIWI